MIMRPPTRIPSPSKRGQNNRPLSGASTLAPHPSIERDVNVADDLLEDQRPSNSGHRVNGPRTLHPAPPLQHDAPQAGSSTLLSGNATGDVKKTDGDSQCITRDAQEFPQANTTVQTPIPRSNSPLNPAKVASSKVKSAVPTTSAAAQTTSATRRPMNKTTSNGSDMAAVAQPNRISRTPRLHMRTQSINEPQAPKTVSTSSTARIASATTSSQRTFSTSSKIGDRNPSTGSSVTSTSRNATPRTSHHSREVSSSAPQAAKQARPAFSTFQQDFTPTKQRPPSSTSTTPAKRSARVPPTSTSTSTITTTTAAPTPSNPADLRAKTHLLHLSLLHAQAPQTLHAYRASAESALQSRFEDLYTLYTRTLLLERDARQAGNLRALHAWSGGNTAALTRKLNVLTGVLGELMALTAPAGKVQVDNGSGGGEGDVEVEVDVEPGDYAKWVERFEEWAAWVQDIWSARDAEDTGEEGDGAGAVPASTSEDGALVNESGDPSASAQDTTSPHPHPHTHTHTQIEGLGDGAKATLRALTNQLNALQLRLRDISVPPIPDVFTSRAASTPPPPSSSRKEGKVLQPTNDPNPATTPPKNQVQIQSSSEQSTPGHVLAAAQALVAGMLEELQVMREVEFEVVVGEKAWVAERVRRIGAEIEAL